MLINNQNIKVLTYCPLHYGVEYLACALQSILEVSDKIVILYSPLPSYGHGTDIQCPETEDELMKIATEVCGEKLVWHNQQFGNEGEHRGFIYQLAEGYDLVLAIDADEIFHEDELKVALQMAYKGDKRYYGIGGYLNFWRSFSWVCIDGFTPVRITNLHNESGEGVVPCTVYHFSCAQREEIMRYKLLIHGHKDEIRPGWFRDIYLKWTPGKVVEHGLHLVAHNIWNATPFDKELLPECLKLHENYNKELI